MKVASVRVFWQFRAATQLGPRELSSIFRYWRPVSSLEGGGLPADLLIGSSVKSISQWQRSFMAFHSGRLLPFCERDCKRDMFFFACFVSSKKSVERLGNNAYYVSFFLKGPRLILVYCWKRFFPSRKKFQKKMLFPSPNIIRIVKRQKQSSSAALVIRLDGTAISIASPDRVRQ